MLSIRGRRSVRYNEDILGRREAIRGALKMRKVDSLNISQVKVFRSAR